MAEKETQMYGISDVATPEKESSQRRVQLVVILQAIDNIVDQCLIPILWVLLQ